jgi:CHRD domain
MTKLRVLVPAAAVALLASPAVAVADQPPAQTFVAVLSAGEEVPTCALATNAARGLAVFHVVDEASGTVAYKLVANNLPGDIIAAHIHIAPPGVAGPVVQALPPDPGAENGVIAKGTFANPALVAAIRADAGNYYVNVHTLPPAGCAPGVIRGQLDDRGPLNN